MFFSCLPFFLCSFSFFFLQWQICLIFGFLPGLPYNCFYYATVLQFDNCIFMPISILFRIFPFYFFLLSWLFVSFFHCFSLFKSVIVGNYRCLSIDSLREREREKIQGKWIELRSSREFEWSEREREGGGEGKLLKKKKQLRKNRELWTPENCCRVS